jgi:hypothetical protein
MTDREQTTVSKGEYHRLKSLGREVVTLADFAAEDIAALEAVRAPESSKAFDQECYARTPSN